MANATVGFLFGAGNFSVPRLHTNSGVSGAHVGRRTGAANIALVAYGLSGLYKIAGTAKLDSFPVAKYRVALARANRPSFIVADANSGADGTFLFDGIAAGQWTVSGYDMAQTVNCVGKANVTAKPR